LLLSIFNAADPLKQTVQKTGSTSVKPVRLIDYALRLGVGAVVRRLGYLLDFYQIAAPEDLDRLRSSLSATYAVLDPMLPVEGPHASSWRLRMNVAPDELEAARRT